MRRRLVMEIRDVPFAALGGVYDESELDAVSAILRRATCEDGDFFPLPEEKEFQDRLAEHEGAAKAIAVNSCGTALDCCMMALGVGPGDEVITTPLTFVCTAGTAVARGAKVVFADIDEKTWCLDPAKARAAVTPKTKAIIPVHFAGLACDIDAFTRISLETGVPIIYDAAHAVGTKYRGKGIGGAGQASCYSFQSNKNMTCLGEGGAVTSDDAEFAEKVRQLKTFGYVYGGPALRVASIGFNYRMTKPQYAAGIVQLQKIDAVLRVRQERMLLMNRLLDGIEEIQFQSGHGSEHGSHLYICRLDTDRVKFSAADLTRHLKEKYKIGTAKHYPPVWTWEAFQALGYDGRGCPISAKVCDQVFSLPIFPRTTPETCEYLAWAIKQSLSEMKGKR
jgi:dTDP-4-amino-4,6-dideoxygalactose transaminase